MAGTTQQITPLIFASDVKHFSGEDILTAPAIGNTTRALSARDNVLAAKINQLVGYANNAAEYVSLPCPRIQLNGLETGTLTNFRIPQGYEARLINCTCWTSLPTSGTVSVLHSAGTFGATIGTSLCTVTDLAEFTAGSDWRGVGEFIVNVANTQAHRINIAASAMISLRPVGYQGGDVVGPGGVTTQGVPGPQGDQGPPGPAGGGGGGGNIVYIGNFARLVSIDTNTQRGAQLQVSPDGASWVEEIQWVETNTTGMPWTNYFPL